MKGESGFSFAIASQPFQGDRVFFDQDQFFMHSVDRYSVLCTYFKLRSISLEVLRSPLHIQAAVIKTHTNLNLTANGRESTSPVSLFTLRAPFAMCGHLHPH